MENEAILRDFLFFSSWQHQKQSNSARLPSKMESWVQSWRPRANAFCDFSSPPVYTTASATKKWCQVIRSAAPVTQNHLKPEDLRFQNATPLRKSCTAPATENASLQILFNVPRLPSFLEMLQNPHALPTFDKVHNPLRLPRETTSERPKVARACGVFNIWSEHSVFLIILTWKCASRHNGGHFLDIATSKSGPNMVCFAHFDFEMCFAPQRRALFRHLNWSEDGVFCTFWLRNVLRATTACNFSSLIWPPAVLASLLFDPPEPQIIGKTQCFATLLPFRALASSFFWLFLFSDLLSAALLFSSWTLTTSAFHLPILSEVWLLNFLRSYNIIYPW